MDMQGQRALPVSQSLTWDALNNPDVLKACIPGCDRFETDGPTIYSVGVTLKIGPVAAKFAGKVSLLDILPPNSYALQFEGQGGVAGFGKGTAQVQLHATGTGCELSYTVNAQVGGKIAQLGQRLIDGAAKSLAEDFFKRFDAAAAERFAASEPQADEAAPDDTAAVPASPANAQTPVWVWGVGAAVLAVAVWFLSR